MKPKVLETNSFCSKCKNATDQEVLHQTVQHIAEEDGWYETNYYQLIRCKGCKTISFRKLYNDAAMLSSWDGDGDEPLSMDLFPNWSVHHLPASSFSNTPTNIRNIYKETIEAYNNNQLILASGGLRATIEGICVEKKIEGIMVDRGGAKKMNRSLQGKIDGLAEQGYLTKDNAAILHDLRFIGNDALHELSAPPKSELKLAIKIVEHTIEALYELPYKGSRLKRKIGERKTRPKP